MPSLPLPSDPHVIRTMRIPLSARWQKPFVNTLIVGSSSGRSYTSIELCTCTDFSSCPLAIPLFPDQLLTISGVAYTTDSGDLRCVRCNQMRPSRFTSLSTA